MPSSKQDSFIHLENLSIDFPLYQASSRSLKKTLFSKAGNLFVQPKQQHQRTGADIVTNDKKELIVQALRNVTLTIKSGEKVGLIGHNGAGKSTLLRAMTGIYEPIHGTIKTEGSIEALLNNNAGMNPALSGRENILLRAKRIGLNHTQTKALEDDVEAFAELHEFLDLPLKIYSSGMAMRLSFGLATASIPNILLMDEWFMTGDSSFQDKAKARLHNVVNNSEIVVLTTHALPILQTWCDRVIWLQAGRIIADGPTNEIIKEYEQKMKDDSAKG